MISYLKIIALEVLLLCSCLLGDYGPQNKSENQIIRALSDSLTHGLIAGVSWSIVCNIKLKLQDLMECIVCVIMGMVVDVDHFVAAKSLQLKDALSLSSRPPFHATSLILIVNIVLYLLAYIFNSVLWMKIMLLFTTAWLSHHIRDASRRGLWLYPFGETPPLPQSLYLSVILCLPLVVRFIHMKWVDNKSSSSLLESLEFQV